MSQHDMIIANAAGATVRADINDALEALVTNNSGSTAPGTTYENMFYFDTSDNIVYMRNAADTDWIPWLKIDQINGKAHFMGNLWDGHSVSFNVAASGSSIATGNGAYGYCVPDLYDNKKLTACLVACETQGSSGTTTIQIRRVRAGASVDMLSTTLTIGAAYTSETYTINATNADISKGDFIYVDVDAVRTGMQGVNVVLTFGEDI